MNISKKNITKLTRIEIYDMYHYSHFFNMARQIYDKSEIVSFWKIMEKIDYIYLDQGIYYYYDDNGIRVYCDKKGGDLF